MKRSTKKEDADNAEYEGNNEDEDPRNAGQCKEETKDGEDEG